MDIDDLRRAPAPDGVECGACGDPAVTEINFYNLMPDYEESYGFCYEHLPADQDELDAVTDAIRDGRDPFTLVK